MKAVRSGIVAWLSTTMSRWSWSRSATVSVTTRLRKYAVASGPTPPSTPTSGVLASGVWGWLIPSSYDRVASEVPSAGRASRLGATAAAAASLTG